MAFLMLLHEKMRLQRKVNKLTLQELRLSSRKERITKNISRVQKYYSSKLSALEKNATIWQNQFNQNVRNSMGLGSQNQAFTPLNAGMSGGVTSFVINQMGSWLTNGQVPKDKESTYAAIDPAKFQEMLQDYYLTGLAESKDNPGTYGKNGYDAETTQAFKMALSQAQMNQSQASAFVTQATSNYQSNLSIWLEAEKERLEGEQDMALAPLEEKETEMDLDKESCEAQLADAKARLESIKQACSEGIKDSAPTFGLG